MMQKSTVIAGGGGRDADGGPVDGRHRQALCVCLSSTRADTFLSKFLLHPYISLYFKRNQHCSRLANGLRRSEPASRTGNSQLAPSSRP